MNPIIAQPTQPGFRAVWHNQFGRPLGDGIALTEAEARQKATESANRELRNANPNWKWRKAKLKIEPWTITPGSI